MKIVITCSFLVFSMLSGYAQGIKEKLYLEVLNAILSEEVIAINELKTNYSDEECFFFSRSDGYISDTESRFEFTYNSEIIKVWPGDHVFFYEIKDFVRIKSFQVIGDKVMIILEKVKNMKTEGKQYVELNNENSLWKLKKVKLLKE